jgi:dihydroorotase-like cyclic amidohydrolase
MPFGGTSTADDFASGTAAAALGGTTTIVDFALHQKGDSLANALRDVAAKAAGKAVDRLRLPSDDRRRAAETIEEIPRMIEREGVNSFKCLHGLQAHAASRRRDDLQGAQGGGEVRRLWCKCTPRTAT